MKKILSVFSPSSYSSSASKGDAKNASKKSSAGSEKSSAMSVKTPPGRSEKGEHSTGRVIKADSKKSSATPPPPLKIVTSVYSPPSPFTFNGENSESSIDEHTLSDGRSTMSPRSSEGGLQASPSRALTSNEKWAVEQLAKELRAFGETREQAMLKLIRGMCLDISTSGMMRRSISMKEVTYMTEHRYLPEVRAATLQTLVQQGAILIDPENPNYVFLPVPPAIKAEDEKPRSISGSRTNLKSSLGPGKMPAFFAQMGPAERHFYERDSAAVLLYYLLDANRYIPIPVTTHPSDRNVECFSIPRTMIEQAKRGEDPDIGIHPYLIPKAVEILVGEGICAPRATDDDDFHFSGTSQKLGSITLKFTHPQ